MGEPRGVVWGGALGGPEGPERAYGGGREARSDANLANSGVDIKWDGHY